MEREEYLSNFENMKDYNDRRSSEENKNQQQNQYIDLIGSQNVSMKEMGIIKSEFSPSTNSNACSMSDRVTTSVDQSPLISLQNFIPLTQKPPAFSSSNIISKNLLPVAYITRDPDGKSMINPASYKLTARNKKIPINLSVTNHSTTLQTPILSKIGVRPKMNVSLNQLPNVVPVSHPQQLRSLQPIVYHPDETSTFARRLRLSLINQHRKISTPAFKSFASDADIVGNLIPYHIYSSNDLTPKSRSVDDSTFENSALQIIEKVDNIFDRFNNIIYSKKNSSELTQEIIIDKFFIQQERENYQNDLRLYKQGLLKCDLCSNIKKSRK